MSKHNHKLAHPLSRLLAFIIDLFVLVLLLSPFYLITLNYPEDPIQAYQYNKIAIALIPFLVFMPIFFRFYIMAQRGQDFGKYLLNLQVINEKANAKIGVFRYIFLRGLIGRTFVFGLIPLFGLTWNAIYIPVDTLLMFRKSRKTIHDSIAGSLVINLPKDKQRKGIFDFSKLN